MKTDGKECKVQFRKPVTVSGTVVFLEDICKFQITTKRGVSLIDPRDIILIEELSCGGYERHESGVMPNE